MADTETSLPPLACPGSEVNIRRSRSVSPDQRLSLSISLTDYSSSIKRLSLNLSFKILNPCKNMVNNRRRSNSLVRLSIAGTIGGSPSSTYSDSAPSTSFIDFGCRTPTRAPPNPAFYQLAHIKTPTQNETSLLSFLDALPPNICDKLLRKLRSVDFSTLSLNIEQIKVI